jgi:hypothetical protein
MDWQFPIIFQVAEVVCGFQQRHSVAYGRKCQSNSVWRSAITHLLFQIRIGQEASACGLFFEVDPKSVHGLGDVLQALAAQSATGNFNLPLDLL